MITNMKYLNFCYKILPVLLIIIVGCKSRLMTTVNDNNLNRQWMMIEFQNYKKEELISKKASLDLSSQQFSAHMGCNVIRFQIEAKDNSKINFSKINKTKIFCQDGQELENRFVNILPKIENYTIEGHFLTLTNSKGDKMKFVASDWD